MKRRRAYNLLELVIALAILSLSVFLLFPRGNRTKDRLSSEMVAKELVSRLRQTRQAALARRISVALAIPHSDTASYSDTAYTVEGDYKPGPPGRVWKIEQDAQRVVFFVGRWSGPAAWSAQPPGPLFQDWWTGAPSGADPYLFAFTPQGKLESNAEMADGAFRILVAQGLSAAGGTLRGADSPWTVWLRPDGQVGLDRGIWAADQAYASSLRESPGGASLAAALAPNRDPDRLGVRALPDNKNPNVAGDHKGNIMDCTSCLTLEVYAQDEDGDPPFFRWETVAVGSADPSGAVTPETTVPVDPIKAGRFGNSGNCRMEWSSATHQWVGRTSWTPAPHDRGGRAYQLKCTFDDRRGGTDTRSFPIDGGWLQTKRESWVLYKALSRANRWELWKMTLEGKDHQRVVGFPNQDIRFGQWTPDGDELVLGTDTGIYRANFDGSGVRLVSTVAAPPLESCCLSPDGQYVFYVNGPLDNKEHHRVDLNPGGQAVDVPLSTNQALDYVFNLSSAIYGGRVYIMENFYRTNRVGFTINRYDGVLVTDGMTPGSDSGAGPVPASLRGVGQSRTTTGGASLSSDGSEVLWGTGGNLYIAPVTPPTGGPGSLVVGSPRSISVGVGDAHHPRYTPDKTGVVFVNGRGNAARLYYLPNINDSSGMRELVLPAEIQCGDEPTVARAR